jgi:hypothetical protein
LWGWEPKEFTCHVYEDGVLVGSVTEREPEFDADQRALLLAHMALERDKGSHGQPMSEATSSLADPSMRGKKGGWHYEANQIPRTDWAAKAVGAAQEAFYKKYPDSPRHGHLWYATRIDD